MNEISTERLSNDIENLDEAEGNKPAAKLEFTIDDKSLKTTDPIKNPHITTLINITGTKSVTTINSIKSKNQSTKKEDIQGNFESFKFV